ncbi:Signal transduction histidine kinase [Actinopolyspora xinjiangensis]|uniref:histidine kinase n=1 Tax=Actinopolyspora xinjiangensis TaxID=405564 RepID=A0A1H0QV04_9ACTN|nr:HAMP domain-containing sensor histidine kinase [Actinopolyspora xinjiangensis]SDP21083.1 Signal transduction histidine kinase [Actinopolyspora xinjiangensis]
MQFRTGFVAVFASLLGLSVIVAISVGFIGLLSLESVDARLRSEAGVAADGVTAGTAPARVAGDGVRVLDTAGEPVDGMGETALRPWEINRLKAGRGVTRAAGGGSQGSGVRWVGRVVADPSGKPLLVLARTDLSAYRDVRVTANRVLGIGSLGVALLVGTATWLAVRGALRPVRRMRLAAAELPIGERLPVPEADDELRSLALATNDMLARRDADTERIRRFTGDAAHELRNPVSSIRAQAEVAVVHPDPELAQETLRQIEEEARRLSELVESLLALARSDTAAPPEARPVELVAAARLVVDRMNTAGVEPRVRLNAPLSTVTVLSTPTEIATVLDNLVANALRHARALVRVSVLPTSRGARLLVDDDGPGVPPRHRPHVFDRFYRAEPDRTRGGGGSGLGLALVAELVGRRGGTVRVGTSPEGGARFEVRLPVR